MIEIPKTNKQLPMSANVTEEPWNKHTPGDPMPREKQIEMMIGADRDDDWG